MAEKKTSTAAASTRAKASKSKRGAKLSSNRVLALYQQAVDDGTTHDEFIAQLRRVAGYSNNEKASARVHRFKSMMRRKHGIELTALKNAPRMSNDTEALLKNFSCLVKG